jgi:hypothetical protein
MAYLGLLRRPPVLVLWSSQALSVLGDRFFALAVMWLALQKSGAVAMGLVAIAESVPYIVMGAVGHRILAQFTFLSRLATRRCWSGFADSGVAVGVGRRRDPGDAVPGGRVGDRWFDC